MARRRGAPVAAVLCALFFSAGPAVAGEGEEEFIDAWANDDQVGAEGIQTVPGFGGGQADVEGVSAQDAGDGYSADDFFLPPDPGMFCDNFNDLGQSDCPAAQIVADAEDAPDEITEAEVEALILQAFESLTVAPSPISYQPEGAWALVNMDFVVYTDDAPQLLGAEVLGVPLTFRLTPIHWTWDFGDGASTPSSTPGQPYPNQTISHVYSTASDGVTVTLQTLWQGEYQVNGAGAWYPVDGVATTTATAGPIEIVAMDVHLVPNS